MSHIRVFLGGKAPKTNSGHLNVKGWEFTIGWRDQIKDFSYYANFNIGDTKSLLKEMEGADSYGAGWNAAVNGYPLNSYFLYRTDGYFKDQAEVDRYYALYGEGKEDLTGVGAGSASRLRPGDTKRLDLMVIIRFPVQGMRIAICNILVTPIHILFSVSHWEEHGKVLM